MIITSTMIVTVIAITITIMEFSCVSETNKHTALSSLSEVGGIRSGPSALFVVNGKTAHRPEFTETKGYGVVRSEISGKYCFRKGGWYGWEPSSSSKCPIRAFRVVYLIEIRKTAPCRAIRGNSISVNRTLPPLASSVRKVIPPNCLGEHGASKVIGLDRDLRMFRLLFATWAYSPKPQWIVNWARLMSRRSLRARRSQAERARMTGTGLSAYGTTLCRAHRCAHLHIRICGEQSVCLTLPVSVKKTSFRASLGHEVQQQKLQSSPWLSALKAATPMRIIIPRSVFVHKHWYESIRCDIRVSLYRVKPHRSCVM